MEGGVAPLPLSGSVPDHNLSCLTSLELITIKFGEIRVKAIFYQIFDILDFLIYGCGSNF